MRNMDRTIVGLTAALVVLFICNFLIPVWVRQIALLAMATGSVALGLLILWRTGLISFGHALCCEKVTIARTDAYRRLGQCYYNRHLVGVLEALDCSKDLLTSLG